jgi:hypothetical protein
MKQKYYGFDGVKLVLIGEFENLSSALDESGDLFYVTTLEEWALFAKEIISTMMSDLKN